MNYAFRQNDIRGVVGKDLADDFIYELGKALATFYRRRQVATVSVGP